MRSTTDTTTTHDHIDHTSHGRSTARRSERKKNMNRNTRRGAAKGALSLLTATALAVMGAFALGSSAASASPGDIVAPEGGGSIVLHKHAGSPGAAGDGTVISGSAAAALGLAVKDVPFKIERVSYNNVPIDLSKSADWDHVPSTLTAAQVLANPAYSLVTVNDSLKTDANGVITYSGLSLGLYLITELTAGAPANIEAPALPFLVSVPFRSANSDTWLYNVNVYPKNKLTEITTKTVELGPIVAGENGVKQGDKVTWTITASVPQTQNGAPITVFKITDALDSRLTYVSSTVKKDGVLMSSNPVTVVGQNVTIEPPIGGVLSGQVYTVEIVTSVNGAGVIPNTAVRNTNGQTTDIGPANTNWGKVQVLKQETGTQATLQGAKFELWTGEANVNDRTKVYGETETNSSGIITFDSVFLGNGTTKTKQYCLKETVPPPGHSIANEWTCVTLNAEAAATGDVPAATVRQAIDNPKRTTPELPLTGSTGTAIFMLGGLALVSLAAGSALMLSRRRRTATVSASAEI